MNAITWSVSRIAVFVKLLRSILFLYALHAIESHIRAFHRIPWKKYLSCAVKPNLSLKRSASGRPPGPGWWWYAVHFRQPGPGVLPLSPGSLER
ncbi:hypothetical protein RA210_U70165 [Rubrivivax sp. A210]|nr:hypothetical protein RA210_U70165 [Rubrivivax sp. A210]